MGNTGSLSKPYIIDQFDSSDEEACYESAPEYVSSKQGNGDNDKNKESEKGHNLQHQVNRRQGQSSIPEKNAKKDLDELLQYLENRDFDSAQRTALILKQKTKRAAGDDSWEQVALAGGLSAASVTRQSVEESISSWSSDSHVKDTVPLSSESCVKESVPSNHSSSRNCKEQQSTGLTDEEEEQRKALEQLDKDLSQFEIDERRVASEVSTCQSGIPKLKTWAAGRSWDSQTEIANRRKERQRQRSPSPRTPGGRPRVSGIPRYGGSQHASAVYLATSSSSQESDVEQQTLSNSITTEITESLTEATEQQEIDEVFEPSAKNDKASNRSGFLGSVEGRVEAEHMDNGDKRASEVASWEINISDLTGRAKKSKKRSDHPRYLSQFSSLPADSQKLSVKPYLCWVSKFFNKY